MLELDRLNVFRGPAQVLRDLSMAVGDRESVCLVGRNGAGKTTTIDSIMGLLPVRSGHVVFGGRDITRLSEAARDRFRADKIGYVFQTFNLLAAFSALENVLLGMTFAGGRSDPARARQLLERVGLAHRLTHKPSMLSVGEQQRVAVARALVSEPDIILADEPTGNLDSGSTEAVLGLLDELHESGRTIVLITHEHDVAARAQRNLVIRDGQITSDAAVVAV